MPYSAERLPNGVVDKPSRRRERTITQTIWNNYYEEVRSLWLPEDGSKGIELSELREHFRQKYAFGPT